MTFVEAAALYGFFAICSGLASLMRGESLIEALWCAAGWPACIFQSDPSGE